MARQKKKRGGNGPANALKMPHHRLNRCGIGPSFSQRFRSEYYKPCVSTFQTCASRPRTGDRIRRRHFFRRGYLGRGAGRDRSGQRHHRGRGLEGQQHFRPRVLLFVGIAGGLKDVKIGDVVVATKVYGYEPGKAGSEFMPRPEVLTPSYRLEQRARAEARKKDWVDRSKLPRGGVTPPGVARAHRRRRKGRCIQSVGDLQVHPGNYGDSIAIEMEGRGLLEAASINERVEALIVRGISDLLDKKDQSDAAGSQELAAALAAAFAFELLANISAAGAPTPGIGRNLNSSALPKYPPAQAEAKGSVVDMKGRGDHRTIAEAINAATPGEQIFIKPGLYAGQLVLEKVWLC